MLIHNGDHAEFEIENAGVPPQERSDWPLPSFDARDWAAAFVKQFPSFDEGTALAWFAGALMRGFDEANARAARARAALAETAAAPAPAPSPADDGWIEWEGGECPVAGGTRVEVVFRSRLGSAEGLARNWDWSRGLNPVSYDIVAYRSSKGTHNET